MRPVLFHTHYLSRADLVNLSRDNQTCTYLAGGGECVWYVHNLTIPFVGWPGPVSCITDSNLDLAAEMSRIQNNWWPRHGRSDCLLCSIHTTMNWQGCFCSHVQAVPVKLDDHHYVVNTNQNPFKSSPGFWSVQAHVHMQIWCSFYPKTPWVCLLVHLSFGIRGVCAARWRPPEFVTGRWRVCEKERILVPSF